MADKKETFSTLGICQRIINDFNDDINPSGFQAVSQVSICDNNLIFSLLIRDLPGQGIFRPDIIKRVVSAYFNKLKIDKELEKIPCIIEYNGRKKSFGSYTPCNISCQSGSSMTIESVMNNVIQLSDFLTNINYFLPQFNIPFVTDITKGLANIKAIIKRNQLQKDISDTIFYNDPLTDEKIDEGGSIPPERLLKIIFDFESDLFDELELYKNQNRGREKLCRMITDKNKILENINQIGYYKALLQYEPNFVDKILINLSGFLETIKNLTGIEDKQLLGELNKTIEFIESSKNNSKTIPSNSSVNSPGQKKSDLTIEFRNIRNRLDIDSRNMKISSLNIDIMKSILEKDFQKVCTNMNDDEDPKKDRLSTITKTKTGFRVILDNNNIYMLITHPKISIVPYNQNNYKIKNYIVKDEGIIEKRKFEERIKTDDDIIDQYIKSRKITPQYINKLLNLNYAIEAINSSSTKKRPSSYKYANDIREMLSQKYMMPVLSSRVGGTL
jgi:hypothetical protein